MATAAGNAVWPDYTLEDWAASIKLHCRNPRMQPRCGIGDPGIGKTAIVGEVALEENMNFLQLEAGLCPDEELAGLFWLNPEGKVERIPIAVIRRACEVRSLLLLDEVTRCTLQRQGCLMTLINERRIGDSRLHPETIVVLAGNGENTGGTNPLVGALVGRCHMANVGLSLAGMSNYFQTRVGKPGSTLNMLALDWAATADQRTGLFCTRAPDGFDNTGEKYPNSRNLMGALEGCAAAIDAGQSEGQMQREMEGCIGANATMLYFACRKLRGKMASRAEIIKDPLTAKIPVDVESAVAAMGVIAMVGAEDLDAAWIYSSRIDVPAIRAALSRKNIIKIPKGAKALAAYQKMQAESSSSLKRTV
jgi:hypothetical protein